MRKQFILIFFIILFSLPLSKAFAMKQERVGTITVDGHGRTLSGVSSEIMQKTGYTVMLDQGLANVKVNGFYQAVELEQFFRRVLKHQNYVLEWNKEKRVVYVKGYGKRGRRKGIGVKKNNLSQYNGLEQSNGKKGKEGIDPVSGLPLDELQHRFEVAIKEGKAMYEDRGIDPVSGLPLDELQHKYELAKNEEKAMYEDSGIDPVSGLPVDELNAKYEAAKKEGKAIYEDRGIDPVSGLPVDELNAKYEAAKKEGRAMYEDQGIDPVTGLPIR